MKPIVKALPLLLYCMTFNMLASDTVLTPTEQAATSAKAAKVKRELATYCVAAITIGATGATAYAAFTTDEISERIAYMLLVGFEGIVGGAISWSLHKKQQELDEIFPSESDV